MSVADDNLQTFATTSSQAATAAAEMRIDMKPKKQKLAGSIQPPNPPALPAHAQSKPALAPDRAWRRVPLFSDLKASASCCALCLKWSSLKAQLQAGSSCSLDP
eukprot:scaffold151916_cov19-Tisochrysis_lutea.AAC.1